MNDPPVTVAGIILAGGLGRRMGGAIKALLLLDNTTLLERIESAIRPHVDRVIVMATAPVVDAIAPHIEARIVIDDGEGPGIALGRIAQNIDEDWILLVGGDHPFPDGELVAKLLRARDGDAVACIAAGRLQPFWALYRTAAIRRAPREARLTALLESLGPKIVTFESRAFLSVNTLEAAAACGCDLSKIQKSVDGGL